METMEKTANMASSKLVESMFKVGAHFGFSKSRRHPSVKPFIFGAKNRTEIIDLLGVEQLLSNAQNFVRKLGSEGKQIIFVGNKIEAREAARTGAEALVMPYSKERWIGGTFTNFSEIKRRIARLVDLRDKKAKGEFSIYPKKEIANLEKELAHLERFFSGIVSMKTLPAAIFVIDPKKEITAVNEALRLNIPIIALAGSDCDISRINYPIVANDASAASIKFFVDQIVLAYNEGKTATAEAVAAVEAK